MIDADADEVAKMLGISRGTVYDLAAPKGPIPCARFGSRCIRFNIEDIEAFKQLHMQSQAIPHRVTKPPTITRRLEVSDPLELNCFEQRGLVLKEKPKRKPVKSST